MEEKMPIPSQSWRVEAEAEVEKQATGGLFHALATRPNGSFGIILNIWLSIQIWMAMAKGGHFDFWPRICIVDFW